MRLSTKGCYGLRAMIELALKFGEGPILMRAIAERQGISRKYLHALLTSLRSAGLVRSVRGSGGGYVLARAPSQIKISEVVQVLEGSLSFADCVQDQTVCGRSDGCVGRDLWQEMSMVVEKLLGSITLADLVTRQNEHIHSAVTYQI